MIARFHQEVVGNDHVNNAIDSEPQSLKVPGFSSKREILNNLL